MRNGAHHQHCICVVNTQTCSIPKPYFHLQTLLMNIYLLLQEWNSAHDVAMQYCKDGMMATLTSTHETTTINSYDGYMN